VRIVTAEDLRLAPENEQAMRALTHPDGFPLGEQLGLWEQWVHELERGELWTAEDLHGACSTRDGADDLLVLLLEPVATAVFGFVDGLDRTFRALTVKASAPSVDHTAAQWWWGRVPLRSSQRLYLLGLWEPPPARIQQRPSK
jgi:hypothetical protein